jgi:glycosyltransferase involved in cell wall biosynthesis
MEGRGSLIEMNKKDKVMGIDGRCLLDANYTGVGEYTITLIKRLLKNYPNRQFIIFLNGFRGDGFKIQQRLAWLRKYKNVRIKHYHFPSKFLNFSLWFFKYPKIDKMLGGVDIFIAPNISFLAVSSEVKFILTVHDLSFERFKETFSWKRRFWHYIVNPRLLCQRANEIWTVSYSTKWDLESLYKIPTGKIRVKPIVRNLTLRHKQRDNIREIKKIKQKYNLPKKFILYLGTVEPRKNILTLVNVFEYLKKTKEIDAEVKLVIAGQFGWKYKAIIEAIEKSEFNKDIILTDFIQQQDKVYFYQAASIFVYPSLFEGFGIPVLEAMANGLPVITSNNSSLPEVVGDGGIMIDSDNADDLAVAIKILINDSVIRGYYMNKGFQQAAKILKRNTKIKLFG